MPIRTWIDVLYNPLPEIQNYNAYACRNNVYSVLFAYCKFLSGGNVLALIWNVIQETEVCKKKKMQSIAGSSNFIINFNL